MRNRTTISVHCQEEEKVFFIKSVIFSKNKKLIFIPYFFSITFMDHFPDGIFNYVLQKSYIVNVNFNALYIRNKELVYLFLKYVLKTPY